VEFRLEDEDWRTSPAEALDAGDASAWVLGVPYDTEVEVRVANDFGAGALYSDTIDAQTGPLPEELPLPALLSSDPDQLDAADAVLFTSIQTPTGAAWRLMVDRLGRVVWAQQNTLAQGTTSWVDSARSGSELLWEDANWFAPEEGAVHRMKIDGSITASYATPNLHHGFVVDDDSGPQLVAYVGHAIFLADLYAFVP